MCYIDQLVRLGLWPEILNTEKSSGSDGRKVTPRNLIVSYSTLARMRSISRRWKNGRYRIGVTTVPWTVGI